MKECGAHPWAGFKSGPPPLHPSLSLRFFIYEVEIIAMLNMDVYHEDYMTYTVIFHLTKCCS